MTNDDRYVKWTIPTKAWMTNESLESSLSLLGRQERGLLEDRGGRRLVCHKRQAEVIDDPVHGPEIRDETSAGYLIESIHAQM